MTSAETVDPSDSLERLWWLNTVGVLARPKQVFDALRDTSDEAVDARQEPITAVVILCGIATVLVTGAAGRLLDDAVIDGYLIAVWAFLAGAIYGVASYWLAGAAVYLGQRGAGGTGDYQQARHVLAYAAVPLIVWLVFVWPVRVALYGKDLFRTGGSDGGTSRVVFGAVGGLFVLWCLGLLALGLRTVYGWDWRRSAIAISLAVAAFLALAVAAAIILRGA